MTGHNSCLDTERFRLAQKRLRAAYGREPGTETPVVEWNVPMLPYTYKEMVQDFDKMLEHSKDLAAKMIKLDQDWPAFIDTLCSVVMVPEAFGCEIVQPESDMPWAKHVIQDISQVWSLRAVPPHEVPSIQRNAEWIDFAQRKLGAELPFWTLDIQSPFSVAAQIVEPTVLMVACITDPKAVHHVCKMVTDYTIEMMQAHIRQMEHPGFPGRNFPSISENIGICVADDTPLIMLSPEMYREFALPYNSEIGAVFGGVHIHSCGDYSHNLDNLMEITNIRSIQLHAGPGEFHLPDTKEEECPFNRARERLAYFVDANDITRGDVYRGRFREHYAEYVLPRLMCGDMTGCILQSCGCSGSDVEDFRSAVRWTRAQLVQGG